MTKGVRWQNSPESTQFSICIHFLLLTLSHVSYPFSVSGKEYNRNSLIQGGKQKIKRTRRKSRGLTRLKYSSIPKEIFNYI